MNEFDPYEVVQLLKERPSNKCLTDYDRNVWIYYVGDSGNAFRKNSFCVQSQWTKKFLVSGQTPRTFLMSRDQSVVVSNFVIWLKWNDSNWYVRTSMFKYQVEWYSDIEDKSDDWHRSSVLIKWMKCITDVHNLKTSQDNYAELQWNL